MPKTWLQKFQTKQFPEIETANKDYAGIPAGEKFLISTPAEIDAYIRSIPEGKSVSFQTMKKDLALEKGVEFVCPLTTGIFTRIVAELAFENFQKGADIETITPFWRAIDLKMPLAKKLSFGTDFLISQRKSEGLEI